VTRDGPLRAAGLSFYVLILLVTAAGASACGTPDATLMPDGDADVETNSHESPPAPFTSYGDLTRAPPGTALAQPEMSAHLLWNAFEQADPYAPGQLRWLLESGRDPVGQVQLAIEFLAIAAREESIAAQRRPEELPLVCYSLFRAVDCSLPVDTAIDAAAFFLAMGAGVPCGRALGAHFRMCHLGEQRLRSNLQSASREYGTTRGFSEAMVAILTPTETTATHE
jgi:hypothetical protein